MLYDSFDTKLLEVSQARETGWAHVPTPERRERAQGAKLGTEGNMETEIKTEAATRTQDRRGRHRNRGRVKDGDRAGPAQGPTWTGVQHKVEVEDRGSKHRAELGKG